MASHGTGTPGIRHFSARIVSCVTVSLSTAWPSYRLETTGRLGGLSAAFACSEKAAVEASLCLCLCW
jgi:hypothetical protein